MNVLVVYAHHEPGSFTSAMKNTVVDVLTHQGHSVVLSDLYAQGFGALAQKWDFATTTGGHFNYMLEQKHAARLEMSFSPDIASEIQKIQTAEAVIFVAPLWWMSIPAILKGWFDRTLAMGVTWDGGKYYEKGLLRGKQAMLVLASGHPREYYSVTGLHKATMQSILHPINWGTLAFCGFDVQEPFIATNVLGLNDAARQKVLTDLEFRVQNMFTSPLWLMKF